MGADTRAIIEPPATAAQSFWQRHKGLLAVALFAVLSFYTRSWEGDLHGTRCTTPP